MCIYIWAISHLLHGMSWYNHGYPFQKDLRNLGFGIHRGEGTCSSSLPSQTIRWLVFFTIQYIYNYNYIYISLVGGCNSSEKYESQLG